MGKREKQAEDCAKASNNLVSDVYSTFARIQDKEYLVFALHPADYDWDALKTGAHPLCDLNPPGGAGVRFVYFKRSHNTPDLEWKDEYRQMPIRRA